MGKSKRSSAETQAHDISSGQKEDRSGTAGEVGEGKDCEEEIGGLAVWGACCEPSRQAQATVRLDRPGETADFPGDRSRKMDKWNKVSMRALKLIVCAIAITVVAGGQSQPAITVKELPPETIPAGACTESKSGFVGVVEKDGNERTKLTPREIGEYVSKRLSEGYSVTLYPQISGRIFAVAQCEAAKH
jgi:hypothetical protein